MQNRFSVAQPTVQIGAFTRTSLVIGGLILIIGGLNDLVEIHKSRQINGYYSNSNMPAVITVAGFNSQGGMKLGFGVAMLGFSGIGVDVFNKIGQRIDKYEESLGVPVKKDLS